MDRVFKLLEENNVVGFATVDKEGNPQARAFQVALIENGKIYFVTAKSKDVYQQMKNNPNVAFTVTSKDYVGLRITGQVEFLDGLDLKEKILDLNPTIKGIYKTADNPELKLLCMAKGGAEIFDMSVTPPEVSNYSF